MKICKVCGEPNASESRFCINCGSESFEVSDVKQKICPECGSVCEPQFTHCVNCGAALGDANVSGVASIQSGGTVSRDSENPDETAVCPYCGAEISLHTVFLRGLRTRRDRNEQTQGCQAQNMPFFAASPTSRRTNSASIAFST